MLVDLLELSEGVKESVRVRAVILFCFTLNGRLSHSLRKEPAALLVDT